MEKNALATSQQVLVAFVCSRNNHYTPVANGGAERRRIHLRITRFLKFMWFCSFAFAAWTLDGISFYIMRKMK